ncbi:DUF1194 domain-containing protein [Frigidibacter sp. RF13]|uniref:DUF1194 domain-containing protein n=1 Tax=Frigidibacter sp. RF13 TaxID=2997340 RepID=UPI00226F387E|nr:DUF1194 domain-containing protein [Frigidibacter sp. RF13]MCY1125513.1 DUF1194 domain-containing protein [Frigidibacter sp. RF13]
MRRPRLWLFCTLMMLATPATAACRMALLLAIDISGSVDDAEYLLQVEGTAAALEDPVIVDALVQGEVALSVMQWSSVGMQKMVQPWRRIRNEGDAAAFARAAMAQERAFGKADTAVGDAIAFAVDQFAAVPDCPRRVIDISGDGVQNAGGSLAVARQRAIDGGISINAIAIEGVGFAITEFYLRSVITKGGFVVTAGGHLDYPRAIRLKIMRELVRPIG